MSIMTQMITFSANGHQTSGYLAQPETNGFYPAVVVLQEWWGLVPHIKEVADRFAEAGFVALAPDLYHGETASEPDEARKLVMAMQRDRALKDMFGAGRYLQALDNTQGVGVVGFCMGGMGAWWCASAADSVETFNAAVAFYGGPPPVEAAQNVTIPVLGLYGSLDKGIPVERVEAFSAELDRLQKTHAIHIYAGAHHAFFNNTRPSYHPEVAENAWQKTLEWFNHYL